MKATSIPISVHAPRADGVEIIGPDAGDQPESHEVAERSDAELIVLIRCDPPDEGALDILVSRYWSPVFARCQMLTQSYDKALDLAQATWCRLLRARRGLQPSGNLQAYLATIATNLFRDSYRASRRAGAMADHRLESLDAGLSNDEGEMVVLVDIVADLKSLQPQEQTLLAMDIDRALEQLSPQLREVVMARFIDGESCAEIGLRHGRTEQTVSGWVREALRQLKSHLEERGGCCECDDNQPASPCSEPARAFSNVDCVA